jgi:hypothetical protein
VFRLWSHFRRTWNLLLRPSRITAETFIGNIPLRCQKCRNTEPTIGVRHHRNTQADAKSAEVLNPQKVGREELFDRRSA